MENTVSKRLLSPEAPGKELEAGEGHDSCLSSAPTASTFSPPQPPYPETTQSHTRISILGGKTMQDNSITQSGKPWCWEVDWAAAT